MSGAPKADDSVFRSTQAAVHVLSDLEHVRVRLGGGLAVLGFKLRQTLLQCGDLALQKKDPATCHGQCAALPQKKIDELGAHIAVLLCGPDQKRFRVGPQKTGTDRFGGFFASACEPQCIAFPSQGSMSTCSKKSTTESCACCHARA